MKRRMVRKRMTTKRKIKKMRRKMRATSLEKFA